MGLIDRFRTMSLKKVFSTAERWHSSSPLLYIGFLALPNDCITHPILSFQFLTPGNSFPCALSWWYSILIRTEDFTHHSATQSAHLPAAFSVMLLPLIAAWTLYVYTACRHLPAPIASLSLLHFQRSASLLCNPWESYPSQNLVSALPEVGLITRVLLHPPSWLLLGPPSAWPHGYIWHRRFPLIFGPCVIFQLSFSLVLFPSLAHFSSPVVT